MSTFSISFLQESRGRWERGRNSEAEWAFEGDRKRKAPGAFSEYERRSAALRKQRSAYVSMRKGGRMFVKPGGTAGFVPVPANVSVAGRGFFIVPNREKPSPLFRKEQPAK